MILFWHVKKQRKKNNSFIEIFSRSYLTRMIYYTQVMLISSQTEYNTHHQACQHLVSLWFVNFKYTYNIYSFLFLVHIIMNWKHFTWLSAFTIMLYAHYNEQSLQFRKRKKKKKKNMTIQTRIFQITGSYLKTHCTNTKLICTHWNPDMTKTK